MLRRYFKGVSDRRKQIAMLHIGLNSGLWHPMDIVFVLTGEVWS